MNTVEKINSQQLPDKVNIYIRCSKRLGPPIGITHESGFLPPRPKLRKCNNDNCLIYKIIIKIVRYIDLNIRIVYLISNKNIYVCQNKNLTYLKS